MACPGCSWTPDRVSRQHIGTEPALRFLQEHGVLQTNRNCPRCGQVCREVIQTLEWRCDKHHFRDGLRAKCNFRMSIKADTWLKGSHLPLETSTKLMCMWLTLPHPRHELIMKELGLASATVVDWSNFFREICIDSLVMRGDQILGGPGVEVEIDKAKLGKRKYNRGRWVEGSWIFGAFERGSRRCFFVKVPDRSAATITNIILDRIAPGTSIFTDSWAGYNSLQHLAQYTLHTVNHSRNFVNPVTGAHTQNIERTWREMRSNIPRFGRKEHHIAGYLAEFCWKRRHDKDQRLHAFCMEIAQQFPPL